VLFLKAKLAIVCTKGFEIMDLQKYVVCAAQPRAAFRPS
jgi:hypothetical protein